MLALCLVNPVTTFAADPAALEKLKSDSDRGDPAALFALGKAYATGDGVAHDDAKAFECYRKSAELGNAKAQHNLGGMYLNGLAVKKDEQEALRWYRKAAEQGAVLSQYALGCLLSEGKSTTPNAPEAAGWLRKAAEQGSVEAQFRLGQLYYHGAGGFKVDRSEAAKWLSVAAAQKHAGAANTLGVMYEEGEAVTRSLPEAYRLFLAAAMGGSVQGQSNLGRCYALGIGIPKDPVQAYRWLKLASDKGEVTATNLLVDYKNGFSKAQIEEGERLMREDKKRN